MAQAGQKVKAHYVGTLDDGTVFDSSVERGEPIEFVCGVGQMIPGFDAAVLEMEVGEKRDVHIPAAEAYGEHSDELVRTFPADEIPNFAELPGAGNTVYMSAGPQGTFPVQILEKTDDHAIFDMNHELAGKDLNFNIELISAEDAE